MHSGQQSRYLPHLASYCTTIEMLERFVKIFNVIQPVAAVLFLYSYFATHHPAWLASVVIFLAFSVLASSALTFLFFSKRGALRRLRRVWLTLTPRVPVPAGRDESHSMPWPSE